MDWNLEEISSSLASSSIFLTFYQNLHREKKFNWIKEILAYEIFICRQWNNLFDSMISFIWMTTVSMKYGNIELIKILFKPSNVFAWWNLWIA